MFLLSAIQRRSWGALARYNYRRFTNQDLSHVLLRILLSIVGRRRSGGCSGGPSVFSIHGLDGIGGTLDIGYLCLSMKRMGVFK